LNGQGWSLESLPPAGADLATAVTCPNDCWAVGQFATPGNGQGLFADDITGSQAAFASLPTPPGIDPIINAISCAQINYCEAVGAYHSNATDRQVAFAEQFTYTPPPGHKCTDPDCPPPRPGTPHHYSLSVRGTEAQGATVTAGLHKPRTLVLLVQGVYHHHHVIVGLVPLGNHRAGRSRMHWNLRVAGRALGPGTYAVSLHSIAVGLVGPDTPPGEITLTVKANGRVSTRH
jgi:hypothetical protein